MGYLIFGVLLFGSVHLAPALPLAARAQLIARTDTVVYKALFSAVSIVGIVLMVYGWKATTPEFAFRSGSWSVILNLVLMLMASVMFLAPYIATNLRRFVRHPQLTGVILWGIGHVLASGQIRSLVLFGGLTVWAVVEIFCLNRRDGAWQKPPPVGLLADFKLLLAGIGFFALFMFTHVRLFGVSPVPAF